MEHFAISNLSDVISVMLISRERAQSAPQWKRHWKVVAEGRMMLLCVVCESKQR